MSQRGWYYYVVRRTGGRDNTLPETRAQSQVCRAIQEEGIGTDVVLKTSIL